MLRSLVGVIELAAVLSHLIQRDSPVPGPFSIQWFHHKTLNRNEELATAYHPTVLRQVLQCVPRLEFERLATKLDGPRGSDALSRWSQFLALVVGHVGQRHSLRDFESALMNDPALRYHLDTRSVSRSALAGGNEELNANIFQELLRLLYTRLQSSGSVPGKRFRFKGKVFSLDGASIDLSMKVFAWADVGPKKSALTLHQGLDHDGLMPAFDEGSGGLESEMDVADSFAFPRDSVVVFDRGYSRDTWHKQLTERGLFWVTRAHKGVVHAVVKSFPGPESGPGLKDQISRLTSRKALACRIAGHPSGRVSGFGNRQGLCLTDQPTALGRANRGRSLQVPLGDRTVLQVDQAEPQDPQLPRSQHECRRLADLRRPVRVPAGGLPGVRVPFCDGHPGRPAPGATEPVPAQALGRSPPRSKTGSTRPSATPAAEGRLSGTAWAGVRLANLPWFCCEENSARMGAGESGGGWPINHALARRYPLYARRFECRAMPEGWAITPVGGPVVVEQMAVSTLVALAGRSEANAVNRAE